jgi:hypothetical protein
MFKLIEKFKVLPYLEKIEITKTVLLSGILGVSTGFYHEYFYKNKVLSLENEMLKSELQYVKMSSKSN